MPKISRRNLLKAAAAGSAAAAFGLATRGTGIGSLVAAAPARRGPDESAPWFEASIPDIQALMTSGELTSRELTQAYLRRIDHLNPLLGAVIETNAQAVGIAARLDGERHSGRVRGPLHGIPVLVKDNIATDDAMETTAGSLALVGTRVPADALLIANLRRAGAVILGKANLSEWANFRGIPPADFPFATNFLNGWSARGGFTFDPYLLSFDPCGSSTGSAVAPAANMCAAAIGTETDGSIVCPAGNNMVVGLKPTVGLISQSGIIPIAHSQDSAGPIARSVTDVAVLLNVLKSPWGPVAGHALPADYTLFLDRNALQGARIGIERRLFEPQYNALPEIIAVIEDAIAALAAAGATIVDPVDTGDVNAFGQAEFTVLLYEFKGDVAAYLSRLRFERGDKAMRSLADLIAFDREHCHEEMKFFGQEIFELAELSGNLSDMDYINARNLCLQLGRDQGIDRVMAENDLDAVLLPSYTFGSSAPAVAGYPIISVPVGLAADGKPVGAWIYAGFLQEPKLISIAYAMEQLLQARSQPQFAGSVPADPPDAGLCQVPQPAADRRGRGRPEMAMHLGTGRPFLTH